MPSLLPYRPLRILCDLASSNHARDQRTSNPPFIQRSSPTVLQLGFALDGTIASDIDDVIESVTVQVRESSDAASTVLMEKSALLAAMNAALTDAEWRAKTGQHASIAFSAAECNIEPGEYWLSVVITTSAGPGPACAFGKITITEDGATSDGDPADAIAETYSTTQADARFLRAGADGENCKHGTATLALDDATKAIAFTTAFASAPTTVVATLIAPSDGYVISHTIDASPTASGFTARFGTSIPGAGYKLSWLAFL